MTTAALETMSTMQDDSGMEEPTTTSWEHRYRPTDLDGMALAPEHRNRFKRYLAGKALPRSLILHGRPGFGKTTIANIIARTLYGPNVLWVKSGESGNVETVRQKVIAYMGGYSLRGRPKLVLFEETTGLSPEAQNALKDPLERFAENCLAIFITNDLSKLDAAIQSRCDVIELGRPPIEECARVLEEVLKAENVSVPGADVRSFTRGHFHSDDRRDLRTLLSTAEHYIKTDGSLPLESVSPPPRLPVMAARTGRCAPSIHC
jgi:DNA polymerase III delta prime subunit